MKKFLISFVTVYTLFAICHTPASAHVGGGPPFLKVDDTYAVTNPYYFNDPSINIPQDTTGQTYLVNKELTFIVDTDKLLVPPDIANASTFRWTFPNDSQKYEYGKTLKHTYTKPGSYIISLEVRAPQETEYTLIDTVELDILPYEGYILPKASIAVETTHRNIAKPMLFTSTSSVDKTAKKKEILWGFGDGTKATDQNAMHTYTAQQDYSTFPVIFRVTDSNGFYGYAGTIVYAMKGTAHFIDNTGKEDTIPVSETIKSTATKSRGVLQYAPTVQTTQSFPGVPIVIGGIIFIAIVMGVIVGLKKQKK